VQLIAAFIFCVKTYQNSSQFDYVMGEDKVGFLGHNVEHWKPICSQPFVSWTSKMISLVSCDKPKMYSLFN